MPSPPGRISTSALVVIVLVLLLVAYPLSIGPVSWACFRWEAAYGELPDFVATSLQVVYFPLVVVVGAVPPGLSSAMSTYVNWWLEE